jgi:small conductance mechanosensitive channel
METLTVLLEKFQALFGIETPLFQSLTRAALILVGTWLVWMVGVRLLAALQRRLGDHPLVRSGTDIFPLARKTLKYGVTLVGGAYLIRLFAIEMVEKLFFATMIMLLAGPAKAFLIILLTYLERNVADRTDTMVDNIIFDLANKFAGAIVYATSAVLALDVLGINVMPFVAGAGVAGVAVGFAAKDTLSNLIAGVLLIIDRPFEIGDRIEVWSAPAGSATWGDVIDIGLRATRIRTTDNIVIIIPNNEIMTRDIVNYTGIDTMIRVRINIGIAYDADMERAKTICLETAEKADWVATDPPPKVVVRNFGESAVDLQLRVWIHDARQRMNTISFVTDQVKTAFDAAGIEIPFPKRDITILQKQ